MEGAFLVAAVIVDAEFDLARACTWKRTAQNMHGPFCVRIVKSRVLKSLILKHPKKLDVIFNFGGGYIGFCQSSWRLWGLCSGFGEARSLSVTILNTS